MSYILRLWTARLHKFILLQFLYVIAKIAFLN